MIDNILISLDDSNLNKQELEHIFDNSLPVILYSSLGKLIAAKLVTKEGRGVDSYYKISKAGTDLITKKLDALRYFIAKKGENWTLVSVSVPEKNKLSREKIRFILKNNGLAKIKNGLYLGNIYDLDSLKKKIGLLKNTDIIYFDKIVPPKLIFDDYAKYWSVSKIKKLYISWNNLAKDFLKNTPNEKNKKRIIAKTLVYDLSNIILKDPRIDTSKCAKELGRAEALKNYDKIREFCY